MDYNEKVKNALERAIKAGNECYFAFNNLAVETKVNFQFYATDLYKAIELCKAWLNNMQGEE